MSEPVESSREPVMYDHYEVVRTLGNGAMGVVYLARDIRIGRQVALKTLQYKKQRFADANAESEYLERFRREAELSGSLAHPNIITLYEVGYNGRRLSYLAMEYVEGESLLSLLNRAGALSIDSACRIIDDVLQGLAYAHGRGVIHRDIKPANILVTMDGRAKIADFGVARSARSGTSDITSSGQLLGTPHYMAPEQVSGRPLDGRSDLFSLGALFYELLTGVKPFNGRTLMDVLFSVVNEEPKPLESFRSDVPIWMSEFIHKLLRKQPEQRFESSASAAEWFRVNLRQSSSSPDVTVSFRASVDVRREMLPEDTPTTPLTSPIFRSGSMPRVVLRDRLVPRRIALSIVAAGAVALIVTAAMIDRHIEAIEAGATSVSSKPLDERKAILNEAKLLFDAGAYKESAARYQAYLQRYPWAEAAQDGLQKSIAAADAEERARLAAIVEVRASRPKNRIASKQTAASLPDDSEAKIAAGEEPEQRQKKKTVWSRIRRLFGAD